MWKKYIVICTVFVHFCMSATPRVSIITSLYKGDEFIHGFMHDITQQTIFKDCELIIINANSPGDEESVIKEYTEVYPNIVYKRLDKDPGIYAVWNMAIEMAQAPYVTNANVDDRFKSDCYEMHANALDENQEVDLVYSDLMATYYPNETFLINRSYSTWETPEFSVDSMRKCVPNNHPMWRKSMHKKYGMFNIGYKHLGDYEMWLRAVQRGSKFLKVPGVYSLYYYNPKGLSTDPNESRIAQENKRIVLMYGSFFNWF